eukprot:m.164826 g.164826  ORF g.164826 m.164826 type:complete len:377 (+) comp14410_c0_seq4:191-1321(+)
MADLYLAKKVSSTTGAEAEHWAALEGLYTRKLWHQLTGQLLDLMNSPLFADSGRIELFQEFISPIAESLNQQSFVQLALLASLQADDAITAVSFLETVQEKVPKKETLAHVELITAIAELQLKLTKVEETKELLAEASKMLDTVSGITETHASYYRVSADYFKYQAMFDEFYTNSLRFLGCLEADQLPPEEQVVRATDLSLAALLGKSVYNFGELLAHPILESLKGTEQEWLTELLDAFNAGDLARFESLSSKMQINPDLAANMGVVRNKISLLALMELVFNSPPHARALSFQTIADAVQVPLDQVEFILMKALGLKLVKGSIDQVAQIANLYWVQPRVLNLSQVGNMAGKFKDWGTTVDETSKLMEQQAPELFVQ